MDRLIAVACTTLLLGTTAPMAAAQSAATLRDAYRGAFLMGAAVNDDIVTGKDTAGQRIVLREFDSVSPENVMKTESVNPKPGVYNWGPADAYVEFGRAHHMFVHGHTLVWHNQTPTWFWQDSTGKPRPPAEVKQLLHDHIQAEAGRYAGKIDSWDVVNEVIDNDGSYRNIGWVKALGNGDSLVIWAFRWAAQYDPKAELYYNDFNTWRPAKRDGIVRLVRMLKQQGLRIDGVGMQAHWGLDYPSTRDIEAAIDSFAATGVKVSITELDVDVLPLSKEGQIIGPVMTDPQFQLPEFKKFLDPYQKGLPAAVQKQLADRYAELFRIFYRKRDKIERVTLWGVHDAMSWKNDRPVPGRTNYPLLFDRKRQPKPAFWSVLRVPQQATGKPARRLPLDR